MSEDIQAKRLLLAQSCSNCFIRQCLPLSASCPLDNNNEFWCKEWAATNVFGDELYAPRITTIKHLVDVLNMIHSYKGLKPFTKETILRPPG